MIPIKKFKSKVMGIPVGLVVGVMSSLLLTFIGTAIVASLLAAEKIGEDTIRYAVIIIHAISGALGAFLSVSLTKRLRLQVSLLSGVCYYLMLLAMTALFFGGRYQGIGVTAVIIMAVCLVIAFLPAQSGELWKKRKKAYR